MQVPTKRQIIEAKTTHNTLVLSDPQPHTSPETIRFANAMRGETGRVLSCSAAMFCMRSYSDQMLPSVVRTVGGTCMIHVLNYLETSSCTPEYPKSLSHHCIPSCIRPSSRYREKINTSAGAALHATCVRG